MSRVVVVGSLNTDRIVHVDRIPMPGETVSAHVARLEAGGKGANQAHYAAGAASTSTTVAMIGRVGDDAEGRALVEGLARVGVDVDGITVAPENTGEALILIDATGENQIVVIGGANQSWGASPSAFAPTAGDVIVVQAEIPVDVISDVIARAHRGGARVVLNLAPYTPGLAPLLRAGDVLVVNDTEATLTFGVPPEEVDAGDAGLDEVGIVITQGAEGALVFEAGRPHPQRVSAFPTHVADTVGAGDAFVGGLASALAEGVNLAEAARRGGAVASLAVSTPGARSPLVTRERVDALLAEAL